MYEIRFLEAPARDLEKLDARIAQRIAEHLRRLSANVDALRLEALTGDLKGLYKLRVGDYRVIYELLRAERVIVVHSVGHRRDVYRKR